MRPTILLSLKCTGSHQRNGTSPVCIRCMVLEIQLFLIHALQKVVAPCFRELGPHKSSVSRKPCNVYKRDLYRYVGENLHIPMISTSYVGLIRSLGCPQRKTTKIYCPIIEGATRSTFQRHPSTPNAVMTTNIKRAAAGSCTFPMVQKSCRKMLQRRSSKRHPKIHDS